MGINPRIVQIYGANRSYSQPGPFCRYAPLSIGVLVAAPRGVRICANETRYQNQNPRHSTDLSVSVCVCATDRTRCQYESQVLSCTLPPRRPALPSRTLPLCPLSACRKLKLGICCCGCLQLLSFNFQLTALVIGSCISWLLVALAVAVVVGCLPESGSCWLGLAWPGQACWPCCLPLF